MNRFTKFFLTVCLLAGMYAVYLSGKDLSEAPPLQDGDLVFQTTETNQSMAIVLASGSLYTHTGVVAITPDGPHVIDAARTVREGPLTSWVHGGIAERFSIYRYKDLSPEQGKKIVAAARSYIGRSYDFYFSFDNDTIYCSELDYLAFKDADVPLGFVKKIGELHINNSFVKKIIEQRWQQYPACQGKQLNFEQCYDIMMAQQIITPVDVAHDPHLELLFTNYP